MQNDLVLYTMSNIDSLCLNFESLLTLQQMGSRMKNAIAREKGLTVESKYFQWAAVHVALSALCSAQK